MSSVWAQGYLAEHSDGWHWYQTQSEPTTVKSENLTADRKATQDPLSELKQIQGVVSEAKANAVLNPTKENVAYYIALQNLVTQNAVKFGNVWQQVIWQSPELDLSLKHPVSQIGTEVYMDSQSSSEQESMKRISAQYGLFFFFAGKCPYCHKFAPIVKDMQDKYGFSVVPVSLDGGVLPEYQRPVTNQGQAQMLKVDRWPALFLVDPKKRQVIPITYGLITEDELVHRMAVLVKVVNNEKQ